MSDKLTADPLFTVEVISQTPNPQQTIYAAMHQYKWQKILIDECDRYLLEDNEFCVGALGYVVTTKKPLQYLHRMIMESINGSLFSTTLVDHKNMNKLDNRRLNLRLASKSQNMANRTQTVKNTSGYKGVRFHTPTQKWQAYIKVDYRQKSLGLYTNKLDAARAYNKGAVSAFGEFARLNEVI
jgi:hypothetical protein